VFVSFKQNVTLERFKRVVKRKLEIPVRGMGVTYTYRYKVEGDED